MKPATTWSITTGSLTAIILVVFWLGLGTGYMVWHAPAPPPVSLNSVEVPCVGVLDGDTLRVDWEGQELKVRLLGIECLEVRRGRKFDQQMTEFRLEDWAVENTGLRAKTQVESHALDRIVTLIFPGNPDQRDAFGRLLAYLEVDDRDVGQLLLSSGLAYEYPTGHPRKSIYQDAAEEARRRRLGVWSNSQ